MNHDSECEVCRLFTQRCVHGETTPEQEIAFRMAERACTPEEHEAASLAMRAAFPSIAAAYSDEEPS